MRRMSPEIEQGTLGEGEKRELRLNERFFYFIFLLDEGWWERYSMMSVLYVDGIDDDI